MQINDERIANPPCRGIALALLAFGLLASYPGSATGQSVVRGEIGSVESAQNGGPFGADESIVDDQVVEQLVLQLGARSFADRQIAAEKLWQLGPGVSEQLERYRDHEDATVAKRVQSILAAFELGIDASTPQATALMVMHFENGEAKVRGQIISNLRLQRKYRLLLDLISRIENPARQRKLYRDNIELDEIIPLQARQDEWEFAEQALTHPLCWENDFPLCFYWAKLNGRVAEVVGRQKTLVDKLIAGAYFADDLPSDDESASGDPPRTAADRKAEADRKEKELLKLIRMYRIEGDYVKAMAYAEHVTRIATRQELVNRMLMEQGNWSAVSAKVVDRDATDVGPDDDVIRATLPQQVLAHHFAGNIQRREECILRLLARVEEQEQSGFEDSEDLNSNNLLANIFLLLGDWERAEKFVDPKRTDLRFDLLCYLNRYQEAFEEIELGTTLKERLEWFERLTHRLESIHRQFERVGNDAIEAKSIRVFGLGIKVAEQLGSLGFTEEAILHLRTLVDQIELDHPASIEKRSMVLRALMNLERYEQVWQVVQDRFLPSEYNYLMDELFLVKASVANYWNSRLIPIYPDPLERLKVLAVLMDSPLKSNHESYQADEILSDLSKRESTFRIENSYRTAKLMQFQGRFDDYVDQLNIAAELAYAPAVAEYARLALMTGNLEIAETYFDKSWRATDNTVASVVSAGIKRDRGATPGAQRLKLNAFANWLDAYRTDSIVVELRDNESMGEISDFLTVLLNRPTSKQQTNETYRKTLAEAMEGIDPVVANNHWRVYAFDRNMAPSQTPTALPTRYSALWMARKLSLLGAVAAVQENRPDDAVEHVRQFLRFRPGDSEVAETVLPALERAGYRDRANRLFEEVERFFVRTLSQFPDSAIHNNNYAWSCVTNGKRVSTAKQHVEIALATRPNNTSYLDTLAEIEFALGNSDAATNLSLRCVQYRPDKLNYLRQYLRFRRAAGEPSVQLSDRFSGRSSSTANGGYQEIGQ